ncbi:MAG: hypothetical protein COB12_11950 [Flavobacterium sp.]|nr:MAG: hypothetical protein COB12_11950 [Flavobacterium sp.]
MSGLVNSVVEIGTFGLIDDVTGVEAAQKAAGKAAGVQAQGVQAGIEEERRQFDVTQQNLAPFREAGVGALEQQQALLGLGGQDAQTAAFASFNESPGQKFIRERAQKNLVRNASAIGGLGGGNVRSALVEQGTGFAQQDFNNQFGRLGQIAGQGQAATTTTGQFGAQSSGNIANLERAGSEARASGILGKAQAESQFTNQLLQLGGQVAGAAAFSDERLKTDIKLIDNDENGNIYEFKYINSDILYTGRMAQELQKIRPDAVSMHKSGYLMVTEEFRPRAA